jgi:hypothetical protein
VRYESCANGKVKRSRRGQIVMSGAISHPVIQSQEQSLALRSIRSERLFYVIAGSAMLLLTAVGFRLFLVHGKGFGGGDITHQIVPLVVVHGVAMFSWIILFLVQSIFILNGNRRLHMRIGVGGAVLAAVLAACMVPLGSFTAILSTRHNPEMYQGFSGGRFFLATMLGEMLSCGVLVTVAVIYRRRSEIHRPMMLLASLVIISGSLGRCPYIGEFAAMPPLYVLGPALVLGALFAVLRWGMTRTFDRWYGIGYSAFAVASVIFIAVGRSALWNQIAGAIPQ